MKRANEEYESSKESFRREEIEFESSNSLKGRKIDDEYERHIKMQDKMFPDWRKYWIYTRGGNYIRKDNKKVNL